MSFDPLTSLGSNELEFLAEARDGAVRIEAAVIAGLAEKREAMRWAEIMRLAHSLKGGAGMLGFPHLEQSSHHLEDALYQIRQQDSWVSSATLQALLDLLDVIKEIIRLNSANTGPTSEWIQAHLSPVVEILIRDLGQPDQEGPDPELLEDDESQFIRVAFETEIAAYLEQLQGILLSDMSVSVRERALKIIGELESLGYMLNLEELTQISQQAASQLTEHPEEAQESLASALERWRALQDQVLGGAEASAPWESQADPELGVQKRDEANSASVRVESYKLDELSHELDEVRINCNSMSVRIQRLEQILARFSEYMDRLSLSQEALRVMYDQLTPDIIPDAEGFDPLEMDQYNPMHLIWQEMIELSVRLQEVHSDAELVTEEADSTLNQLHHTSRMAQQHLRQIRMRPLEVILHALHRSSWEIAERLGKQVELEFRGEKTLLERRILENLRDPLMHLLRNALDHGLETPQERLAQGKPSQGKIAITAEGKGSQILIQVEDDGRGVDLDKLRLRSAHHGSEHSPSELVEMIFEPGLSTAERVTELSGRGIGLDVVRSQVEAMAGKVEVESHPGQGTRFMLTIPRSLSAIRALLVEREGLILGIPANHVVQITTAEPGQLLEGPEGIVLRFKDELLVPRLELLDTLASLAEVTLSGIEEQATVDYPCLLLLRQGSRVGFVEINRCWREREVMVRQVEGTLSLPSPFGGCSILGDGQILPILNVADLFNEKLSSPKILTPPQTIEELSSILVVDDSIHIRQHLCRALQKGGFRTFEAKDGQEALDKLRSGLEIQGLISDIEMPRLDGYGLLRSMGQTSQLASIPVLILTSRSGAKHRQRALELGAADYIVKPCRDHELVDRARALIRESAQSLPASIE